MTSSIELAQVLLQLIKCQQQQQNQKIICTLGRIGHVFLSYCSKVFYC